MRWTFLVVRMLFAATLPIASAEVWAQPDDVTGIWRDEAANDDDATTPQKVALPGKPAFRNNFHGSYASKPYLLIQPQDKQKPQGPFFLYSDVGDLRAELRPTAATPTDYDIVDRRTQKTIGKLRMDAPECNGRPACFTLQAAANDLGFDPDRDNLPVLYVPVGQYDPHNDPQLDQTFGNMFSPLSANFSYILKCWHLGKMNPIDYQVPGCGKDVFTMPDTKSFGYRKIALANWHNAAIPFGWTYVSTLFQNGEDRGQTWENGQDVAEADSLKVGVKASVNVFGVSASTHMSVGVQNKVENMYNSKLTYSKAEYLSTQFALVLHKFYAAPLLDPSFVDRVQLIKSIKEANRTQEYDRFVADFGTHYANAITFGSKGERVLRMNQKQVLAMHEGKVDVSVGMTAGYMGNSASVDVDASKSNMEKITSNTSKEDRQWFCYSGGTCNDGIPSGEAVLPVQLDLRPVSELFAPPFFDDDEIITTIRDGISRAVAKAAFVKKDNLNAPTAVFATVTGLNRTNITSIGSDIGSMRTENQPCGVTNACRDGAVTLTSKDGSATKMLGSSVPQPVTWNIPATLNPNQYPGNPAPGYVTASFTWSGKCLDTTSTWEYGDSAGAQVTIPDLTVVPGNISGMGFVLSPNCVTNNNRMGVVTVITPSTITGVVSARSLLEK